MNWSPNATFYVIEGIYLITELQARGGMVRSRREIHGMSCTFILEAAEAGLDECYRIYGEKRSKRPTEHYNCKFCGKETFDLYILKEEVWKELCQYGENACLSCFVKEYNKPVNGYHRYFSATDFTDAKCNDGLKVMYELGVEAGISSMDN